MATAEQTTPGRGRCRARRPASKWIDRDPRRRRPGRRPAPRPRPASTVDLGRTPRGTVELAPAYADPASALAFDPATERAPEHTAAEFYDERWMFHGPEFQGVSELTAIGDQHVRGVMTTPAAPGALLDNVGQLLGYWIMSTCTDRTIVFPVGMDRITFYGPPPRPGSE